ncbi:MAG: hypothetical protein WAZ27_02535 [Minisyncoccia bacterium]
MNPLKKELYVAIHGQTARFRMVKYAILLPLFAIIYWFWGGEALFKALGIALIFAIAMHLFYRWKSKSWIEPYGPYTPPPGMPE